MSFWFRTAVLEESVPTGDQKDVNLFLLLFYDFATYAMFFIE